LRGRSGVLKPVIVIQLLVVMVLAGVGTAFAVEPGGVVPTATPVGGGTPVAGSSLEITSYSLVYNAENTQVTGVMVMVRNKDTAAAHSGTVNVAIDQEGETITGQGIVNNLAASATTQITVDLGSIAVGTYLQTMRIVITQTS
jgi:hypothetical protein